MTEQFAVETKDLTKSYDGITVVDGLNLHVKENEIFGLLGPNGAGKTTSILMLLGLTEPSSGAAHVCGFNSTRDPLHVKRLVGYLPENVGFYENLTARQNLRFIAELNHIDAQDTERRISEMLKMVGLTKQDKEDLAVGKYSKGMKQRLGIADVLIKQPKVVFLDEPTSGLDPEGINHLLDLIGNLPKMGTTVVLSSHQLYQVQRVCQSIGILSKGKMVIEGPLDKLSRDALTGGQYIIEIETVEPSPQLADIIKKIHGVSKVEVKDRMLRASTDADLRSEIAKAVVQSNIPMVQIKVQEFSLDDIYMKYFQEG